MSAYFRSIFAPRFWAPIFFVLAATACDNSDAGNLNGPSDPAAETFASALGVNVAQMTERASRLFIQDIAEGSGAEAVAGSVLRMRYTGWLRTGVQFDSNVNSGQPFEFILGRGEVISGWDIGVAGMREGGRRRLVLGSEHGYRSHGSGSIPPNSTLVFDVELVSIVQ